MRRAALFTLTLVFGLSLGIWTGRASVAYLPSDAQLQEDFELAQKLRKTTIREELRNRIMQDVRNNVGLTRDR